MCHPWKHGFPNGWMGRNQIRRLFGRDRRLRRHDVPGDS